MNKALLIGRLTKDPELKITEATKREVCQFTIAVNRQYKNEDGETPADFLNCVVWDKLAENLCKYQKKGNQVAVEGRIQTRNYENNEGKKVYVTEILVNNISFLDSKKDNSNFNNLEEPPIQKEFLAGSHKAEDFDNISMNNDPFANFREQTQINDDDLPF